MIKSWIITHNHTKTRQGISIIIIQHINYSLKKKKEEKKNSIFISDTKVVSQTWSVCSHISFQQDNIQKQQLSEIWSYVETSYKQNTASNSNCLSHKKTAWTSAIQPHN